MDMQAKERARFSPLRVLIAIAVGSVIMLPLLSVAPDSARLAAATVISDSPVGTLVAEVRAEVDTWPRNPLRDPAAELRDNWRPIPLAGCDAMVAFVEANGMIPRGWTAECVPLADPADPFVMGSADPSTRTVRVGTDGASRVTQRATLAHELTHAWSPLITSVSQRLTFVRTNPEFDSWTMIERNFTDWDTAYGTSAHEALARGVEACGIGSADEGYDDGMPLPHGFLALSCDQVDAILLPHGDTTADPATVRGMEHIEAYWAAVEAEVTR